MKRRLYSASFAVLFGVACGSTPRVTPEPSGRHRDPTPITKADDIAFTLASYNINFGNGHDAQTVETIAALGADVILLQETTEASEAAVLARLEDSYPEIRFNHCCRAGGLGVLSRFEILDEQIVPTDIGMFPAMWVRLETPRGPIVVVNVHLHPPISERGSRVVGFFSTRSIRAREIAALWYDVPKGRPIVVAGDFNERADEGVMAFLSREGLRASLPDFVGKEPTWHWPMGAIELRMQLDHVAFSPPLVAVDAAVVRGGLSDHEPVLVKFAWRP